MRLLRVEAPELDPPYRVVNADQIGWVEASRVPGETLLTLSGRVVSVPLPIDEVVAKLVDLP